MGQSTQKSSHTNMDGARKSMVGIDQKSYTSNANSDFESQKRISNKGSIAIGANLQIEKATERSNKTAGTVSRSNKITTGGELVTQDGF